MRKAGRLIQVIEKKKSDNRTGSWFDKLTAGSGIMRNLNNLSKGSGDYKIRYFVKPGSAPLGFDTSKEYTSAFKTRDKMKAWYADSWKKLFNVTLSDGRHFKKTSGPGDLTAKGTRRSFTNVVRG